MEPKMPLPHHPLQYLSIPQSPSFFTSRSSPRLYVISPSVFTAYGNSSAPSDDVSTGGGFPCRDEQTRADNVSSWKWRTTSVGEGGIAVRSYGAQPEGIEVVDFAGRGQTQRERLSEWGEMVGVREKEVGNASVGFRRWVYRERFMKVWMRWREHLCLAKKNQVLHGAPNDMEISIVRDGRCRVSADMVGFAVTLFLLAVGILTVAIGKHIITAQSILYSSTSPLLLHQSNYYRTHRESPHPQSFGWKELFFGYETSETMRRFRFSSAELPADTAEPKRSEETAESPSVDKHIPSHLHQGCNYLCVETIMFALVVVLALQQAAKISRINCQTGENPPHVSLTGGTTRTFFISLLVLANFARAISLGFLGYLLSPSSESIDTASPPSPYLIWLLTILRSFPSLLFLSTYSVVILFWAQVYYAAILVSLPLLRPCFVFTNIAAYTLYASAVTLTYLLEAYQELVVYAAFLVGVFYCATALGVAYYGIKVSNKLSERSKQPSRKNSIIRRVLFLAVICPLMFVIRGAYSLAFALNIIPNFYPPSLSEPVWDAIIFFITEWLPSVMILAAFWHRKRNAGVSSSGNMERSSGVGAVNNDFCSPFVETAYNPYGIPHAHRIQQT